jgi:ParB-like chromosome segregation protein Spo0J
MAEPEVICGCEVHPAASVFPLMEGDAFQSLVDSIAVHGVQNPIVCVGHVVIDGRNRLRAVDKLRNEGRDIDLPAVQWTSPNGITATEWIAAQNLERRHLTDDQRVAVVAAMSRLIAAESKAAQKASQFDSATGKAAATKKSDGTVTAKSSSPQKRDRRKSESRTTVAKVAARAKATTHKAKQAIALDKAVEAGTVSPDVQKDVIAGKRKLKDAVPKKSGTGSKAKGGPAQLIGIEQEIQTASLKAWQRLKDRFPPDEHSLLRKTLAAIIREEQKQFDKK